MCVFKSCRVHCAAKLIEWIRWPPLLLRRWPRCSWTCLQSRCWCWAACAPPRCRARSRATWTPWRPTDRTRSAGTPHRLCCSRCAPRGSLTRCPPSGTWWCHWGHQRTANTRRCSGTWPGSSGTFIWTAWCHGVTAWGGDTSPLFTPSLLTVSVHHVEVVAHMLWNTAVQFCFFIYFFSSCCSSFSSSRPYLSPSYLFSCFFIFFIFLPLLFLLLSPIIIYFVFVSFSINCQ